jgi:tRNA threonylcarbamoyladenosine biosynthesis protein TsaB
LKLLAFDTSTEYCSAALHLDGRVLSRATHAGNRHSELLLPMIGELLAEAGLGTRELDGIAFGKGPGSFTGLRIGCGIAQGLALGADLPVVGVVTLEAMAWAHSPGKIIASLDARMHEVYYAAYERTESGLTRHIAPGVFKPDAVPLPEGEGWRGRGNGFSSYPPLAERLGARLAGFEAEAWPDARAIAELALPAFLAGEALPADRAEPFYVRDKVALKTSER